MNLPDAIDHIRPSVVQIHFEATDLDPAFRSKLGKDFYRVILGTGFIVSDNGHVVTAQHVIDGARQAAASIPARNFSVTAGLAMPNIDGDGQTGISIRSSFHHLGLQVVIEDPRHDLALLQMDPNPFTSPLPILIKTPDLEITAMSAVAELCVARPQEGEAVAISGYPLENPVLVTTSGAMASVWSSNIQEVQIPGAPVGYTRPDIADAYLADVQANPGNSGGPVYSIEDGSVIGVCVAGQLTPVSVQQTTPNALPEGLHLFHDAGLTIVTPTKYVTDMLEKARSVPTKEGGEA